MKNNIWSIIFTITLSLIGISVMGQSRDYDPLDTKVI